MHLIHQGEQVSRKLFGYTGKTMKPISRCYRQGTDYDKVGELLVKTYSVTGNHINWLQPRWEYMHYHPLIRGVDLDSIGIWEEEGKIVAVVHPEHSLGTAYFEIDPACNALKREMLVYAEEHICAAANGGKVLSIYINDRNDEFRNIAAEMGYRKQEIDYKTYAGFEAMSHYIIPDPFPEISLPEGFRLKSLAEDNNLTKLNRVMFRGFNHGNEPPDDCIEERKFMQSAPNYRKDLNILVEAPDGNFVSYCGMWYEPVNRVAYVEPVCTDPDYRRMGMASAAVLEGIRRCGLLGATVAYVGTILPVYLSIGFRQIFNTSVWRREWM